MKKTITLCCVVGSFVACSGSSPDVITPPPVIVPIILLDASITDANSSADVGIIDAGTDAGTTCLSESDAVFCSNYQSACGAAIGIDNCNADRTVANGGNCKPTEFCNSGKCSGFPCVPATDKSLCTTAVKE